MSVATPTRRKSPRTGLRAWVLEDFIPTLDAPQVDREAGIIRGVKIIGLESPQGGLESEPLAKRKVYTLEALEAAIPLYEGARAFVNHPAKPGQTRDMNDWVGRFCNVRMQDDGLYGDLKLLKESPWFSRICEAAEEMSNDFGCSPHHYLDGYREGDTYYVTEIGHVASVDVVCTPATTNGLFEGVSHMDPEMKKEDDTAMEQDNMETPPEEEKPAVEQDEPAAAPEPEAAPMQGADLFNDLLTDVQKSMDAMDPSMSNPDYLADLQSVVDLLTEMAGKYGTSSGEADAGAAEGLRRVVGKGKPTIESRPTRQMRKENMALKLCMESGVKLSAVQLKACCSLEERDMAEFIKGIRSAKAASQPVSRAPSTGSGGRPAQKKTYEGFLQSVRN